MIRLDCINNTVHVSAAQCGGVPQTAHLVHGRCRATIEAPSLDVALDETDGTYAIGPIPDDTRSGGYRLFIQTDKCCYVTPVHVTMCPPLELPSIHTPTRPIEVIISCCEEEEGA